MLRKNYSIGLLCALMATAVLPSCKKTETGLIQGNEKIITYDLATMPAVPAFARPMDGSKAATRSFAIKLNDGSVLKFDLLEDKESEQLGKHRALSGKVTINGKSSFAGMYIGENGFSLGYMDGDKMYMIRPAFKLDVGYVNPMESLSEAQLQGCIDSLVKQPQVKESREEVQRKMYIEAGKIPFVDKDEQYRVYKQKGAQYNVMDMEASVAARQKVEGPKSCGVVETGVSSKGASPLGATNGVYYIKLAYMQQGFDYSTQWWYLQWANSYFYQLAYPVHNPYVYYTSQNAGNTSYGWAISYHYSDYIDQSNNLDWYSSYYNLNSNQNGVVAIFHNDDWGAVAGLASYASYPNNGTVLMVSDNDPTNLAHEAGHTMGADHVSDINDLMFYFATPYSRFHRNTTNVNRIRSRMGW
ncbi:zinc-dependent metalloprotease family protein [Edaphocola aurantiacus]|uniref:zinc-dependent metalloprotease family protein n=1 Tax=Edaphocola aurantiacus TaxID=2601682 RepID=UPI001C966768|nr:zinc-dependent metalloprotease family protein [Edaphocola aurantiacus]